MTRSPSSLAPPDPTIGRWDTAIEALVVGLLIFMPLAFGAVEAWSEMVVVVLSGAMVFCLAMKRTLQPGFQFRWSWTYLPILLFVTLVVMQLIPLPAGVVKTISNNTWSEKTRLLGDLPEWGSLSKNVSLSFYPHETSHGLRLLLAVAAVFVVVVNVYRREDQIKRLLATVAIVGGGIAVLAIAQIVSGTDKIYWTVATGNDLADAGTFINHSNYAQFINLSIGAALGLLLVKLHESFRGTRVTLAGTVGHMTSFRSLSIWILAGIFVFGVASVFLSLSRGGAVSLLIALAFTAVLVTAKRAMGGRGWIMALVAMGAFICVLYAGFDAVYERLASLRQQHQYEGRWQIVKDIASAWTRFPLFGTGLGTHEVVYPMFERSTVPALAGHAENEYAQVAEETGALGLGLLVVFGTMVWLHFARCIRGGGLAIRSAAFGLGFGLLAILIHSFSDFGQHLPANAALSALFCGLLVSIARISQSKRNSSQRKQTRPQFSMVGLSVLMVTTGVWIWSLNGANNARLAESHWADVVRIEERLAEAGWVGTNDAYAELISNAAAASDYEPQNVKYRHWLNVYRWRSISRVRDSQTGEVAVTPLTAEFTEQIVSEFHQARLACPTFGATYCVAGQLELFVLNQPIGAEHIRTGYALAPCDSTACFIAGLLDVREGKADESLEKFRRAVALDRGLFREVADVYLSLAERPDLAVALAEEDPGRLLTVARRMDDLGIDSDVAAEARSKATSLLKTICDESDAPAWTLASMADLCRRDENYESAIGYYRRALDRDYGQVHWRLALARLLASENKASEAIHEARVCLRLRPQMDAAKRLIAELSVQSAP